MLSVFTGCVPNLEESEDVVFLTLEQGAFQYSFNYYLAIDKEIYLEAGKRHSFQVFKTITSYVDERKAFFPQLDKLSIVVDGTLEVTKPDGEMIKVESQPFTYGAGSISDPAEIIARRSLSIPKLKNIYFGDKASEAFESYQKELKLYEAEMELYNREVEFFNKAAQKLEEKRTALQEEYSRRQEQNRDTSDLEAENERLMLQEISPPQKPEPMSEHRADVASAYEIQLTTGVYTIRIRNKDGLVVEGTEKKLVCYEPTGETLPGYHVIPYVIWDNHLDSAHNYSVIYTNSKQNLIIRPFIQERLPNGVLNQSKDSQYINQLSVWEKIGYPDDLLVEVSGQGRTEVKPLSPMVAADTQSNNGFTVMPKEEAEESGYEVLPQIDPISAVVVPVKDASGTFFIRLLAADKTEIQGGAREIKIVGKMDYIGMIIISICIALLPLMAWFLCWFFIKTPGKKNQAG